MKRRPRLEVVDGAAAPRPVDHPASWPRPRARTVVIASGKGGVGKSQLAANLSVALGQQGARVLLVDADFAQANLDVLLGLHPRWDLQHVFSGEKTLEEIVVPGPAGVRLVPAASGVPELADLDDFRREMLWRALGQLEEDADLVIVDTPSGVSKQVSSFCLAADEVVVVTTPEMPAFSDAYGLVKLLRAQGLARPPHLLVNMAMADEEAEDFANRLRLIARHFQKMDLDPWGTVPFDPSIARAVRRQEPVVLAFPGSPAAASYRALAARLWRPSPVDPDADARPNPLAGQRQRLGA